MATRNLICDWSRAVLGLVLFSLCYVAQADQMPEPQAECAASPEYLSKFERFFKSRGVSHDYSCLTDFPTISKNLKRYQLVDIRTNPVIPLKDSWNISVDELKLKDFLANRPLLLLDEGFSRVQQASICTTLKQAGFTSVKILVGGIPQWYNATHRKTAQRNQFVSAKDVVYEYFNGRILLVAATAAISRQLEELGFDEHKTLETNKFSELSNIVVSSSNGGYDPVVYLGTKDDLNALDINQYLPNLYILNDGPKALLSQLRHNKLIDYARNAPQEVNFCAQK
ncbi:rhodanese-like domain-containing protein [Cellvibrio japonicus]|uniref:Rhodanese domain-containing protein n=1 Tax=Cellvibrio japonicus (strain Ueda107) TaxID=498211 RepID=B3PEN5_CELJU|nr:rhodanese-like domain-containing protein [Cellvibrio japonicus]ACE85260.1 hypothetical protein CJA_0014 [Cellvibrio japonicus Ueda107]QEI10775.1 rhodanese-like domain-containing protein [Cellvibrio japonicus]QEI14351.1 rhodanese-like domain-containing protein [Cellvibrio japonicus]QEI17929.1 rhodanese-like domain-containing protein [Cellvibrio japonicus]